MEDPEIDDLIQTYTLRFKTIVPSSLRRYKPITPAPTLRELLERALRMGRPEPVWEKRLLETLKARADGGSLTPSEHEDLRALDALQSQKRTSVAKKNSPSAKNNGT